MSITANTHPITKTLGGYRYSALPAKDTTTHTLLTNPTTHYKANDNGVLPNNPNTWIPFSSSIPKTIYDPCPYGYRIPINGSWTGFPANKWTVYDITGGTSWPATNGAWWPAAGYRYYSSSVLIGIGHYANYWSSSRFSYAYQAYYLSFNYNGGVYPQQHCISQPRPIRPLHRREENKQSKFFLIMSLRATL